MIRFFLIILALLGSCRGVDDEGRINLRSQFQGDDGLQLDGDPDISQLPEKTLRKIEGLLEMRAQEMRQSRSFGEAKGQKLGVIGGGPVGQMAGLEAYLKGYDVDVFEKRQSFTRQNMLQMPDKRFSRIESMLGKDLVAFLKKENIVASKNFRGVGKFNAISIKHLEQLLEKLGEKIQGDGYTMTKGTAVHPLRGDPTSLDDGSGKPKKYKWVLAADGAKSSTRQALGIGVQHATSQAHVATIAFEKPKKAWYKRNRSLSHPNIKFADSNFPVRQFMEGRNIHYGMFQLSPDEAKALQGNNSPALIKEFLEQRTYGEEAAKLKGYKVVEDATRMVSTEVVTSTQYSYPSKDGGGVLLVGDAAYTALPETGMGLSSGLADIGLAMETIDQGNLGGFQEKMSRSARNNINAATTFVRDVSVPADIFDGPGVRIHNTGPPLRSGFDHPQREALGKRIIAADGNVGELNNIKFEVLKQYMQQNGLTADTLPKGAALDKLLADFGDFSNPDQVYKRIDEFAKQQRVKTIEVGEQKLESRPRSFSMPESPTSSFRDLPKMPQSPKSPGSPKVLKQKTIKVKAARP